MHCVFLVPCLLKMSQCVFLGSWDGKSCKLKNDELVKWKKKWIWCYVGRNVENNKFTGWVPAELEDIDSIEWVPPIWYFLEDVLRKLLSDFVTIFWRTGGNSWSSGPAPPPPPGAKPLSAKHKDHGKDGNGKNGMSGLAIALIVLASLVVLALLITLLSTTRKSSPSSHFLDEERGSQRAFTPLASQELSHDLHNAKHKEFRGGHLFTNAVFYFFR